ncbi:hypothetical protein [Tindallia californiensis]|uniref:Uncharacterized protein n=1 Tax=Tindallia californiensis TaxID=159292 RepID=A0A1H3MLU3_9FIRM|nr:hypothetical protein [Tindallia californiensis]SDY77358.1 hypothetical protein SAMN05192546_104183 [Tindallia californiensis]
MSKKRKLPALIAFLVIMILMALMVWQQWEISKMQQEIHLVRNEIDKYERYLARYQEDFQVIYQDTRQNLLENWLNEELEKRYQNLSEQSLAELKKQLEMRAEDQQASFWIPGETYGLVVFQYYGTSSEAYQARSVMTRPYHLHVYLEKDQPSGFNGTRQGHLMILKLEGSYPQQFLQILKW